MNQYRDRPPKVIRRLTRDEAVAYLLDALMGNDLPFSPSDYSGGATQIVSDAVCIGTQTVKNYASVGRRTLKKSTPAH